MLSWFFLFILVAFPSKEIKNFLAHNGTLTFTSIDAHRGCFPSPRGDLEILSYNLLFWVAGHLPWQDVEDSPDSVCFY